MRRESVFKRVRAFFAIPLLFAVQVGYAQFESPNSGAVTPSGAYTHSVPIRLPKGVAGVGPQIALNYSSQAGNGLAGVGWNLSGLSTITRCPKTMATDGVRGSVTLTANDALCLDGARLLLAPSSQVSSNAGKSYLDAGAVYFTEVFNGSRIEGPKYIGPKENNMFEVRTKAGERMIYEPIYVPSGSVPAGNPRVEKTVTTSPGYTLSEGDRAIRLWALKRVEDSFGNYFEVSTFRGSDGEFFPVQFRYTGNASAGTVPQVVVNLKYGEGTYSDSDILNPPLSIYDRPDPSFAYMAGFANRNTVRLKTIDVKVAGQGVTQYKLDYEVGQTTGRSRLIKVQECSLITAGSCLAPIEFTWSTKACTSSAMRKDMTPGCLPPSFQSTVVGTDSLQPANVSAVQFFTGDFNGDGLTDILEYSGYYRMRLGNINVGGQGIGASTLWANNFQATYVQHFAGDFDGDGRSDLIRISYTSFFVGEEYTQSAPKVELLRSNGTGFDLVQWNSPVFSENARLLTGDFNGDGRTDFLAVGEGLYYGTANGFEVVQPAFTPSGIYLSVGDFDGDGKSDVASVQSPGGSPQTIVVWQGTDTGFANAVTWWPGSTTAPGGGSKIEVADVNGDGKSDLIAIFEDGSKTSFTVYLSKGAVVGGSGFIGLGASQVNPPYEMRSPWSSTWGGLYWYSGDFDGDGRQELIQITDDVGKQRVWVWGFNGNNFYQMYNVRHENMGFNPGAGWQMGDFNGDGRVDWIELRNDYSFQGVLSGNTLSSGAVSTAARPPDEIISIRSGLGKVTTLEAVSTAMNDGTYEKTGSYCGNATMPTGVPPPTPVTSSMFLVSRVFQSNGLAVNGQIETRHTYGRAWSTNDGRGMRGFCWTKSVTTPPGAPGNGLPVTMSRSTMTLDWPHIGAPINTKTWNGIDESAAPLKESVVSLVAVPLLGSGSCVPSATLSCLAYSNASEEITRDLGGVMLSRLRNTVDSIDHYGNPTLTTTSYLKPDGTSTGYTKITSSGYTNDVNHAPGAVRWFLARLGRTDVTSYSPD